MRMERESDKLLDREIVAVAKGSMVVAKGSMAVARDLIGMDKTSMEKDRETEKQLLEATQSQNALLQRMSLLGQLAVQYCKPTPSHIMEPLDNTGCWEPH